MEWADYAAAILTGSCWALTTGKNVSKHGLQCLDLFASKAQLTMQVRKRWFR
jgi:hypothetical protein